MAMKKRTDVVIPDATNVYRNIHGVTERTWNSWSREARWMFNNMMRQTARQKCFLPHAMKPMPFEHWQTLRFNMAWNAAELVREREERLGRKQ